MLLLPLFFALIASANTVRAQLANSYPNDVGIELDDNVLYVEKFEDGMANILSRYNEILNGEGMSLDADVPTGSVGLNSLKMTTNQGENTGGHLYKRFMPGFDSTVYIRYYVKYPSISSGYFHHEGVWFGGYNPATDWPNPRAGTCGLGSSRLSIAYEPVWQEANPPGMDTYLYWGDMKSYDGGSTCYGNVMITQGSTDYGNPVSPTAPVVALDEWMCVEVMIKLNNPVTAFNGELAIWQNGVKVGHWGPGFPNGHWLKDKWYNNPDDPPFEGFRWRTDAMLNINWLWLEFYHDDPDAPSSYIKFDHLVMAKKYIGPISDATSIVSNTNASPSVIKIYPNPSSGIFSVAGLPLNSNVEVFNVLGEKVFLYEAGDASLTFDLSDFPKGIYFVKIDNKTKVHLRKIIVH